jgi:hypothetical protein
MNLVARWLLVGSELTNTPSRKDCVAMWMTSMKKWRGLTSEVLTNNIGPTEFELFGNQHPVAFFLLRYGFELITTIYLQFSCRAKGVGHLISTSTDATGFL